MRSSDARVELTPSRLRVWNAGIGRSVVAAAVAAVALILPRAHGETITLGTFTKAGGDVDATASFTSTSGGTMSYVTDTDARSDAGLFATLDSPAGYTFTTVGDKVVYTFTYENIDMGVLSNTSPQFRTGFDFASSAFLYHSTSTGTGGSLGFWANTTGNPFTTGTQVGTTITTWSDFANQFIRFTNGNTINATVSLTLDAINGSTYDYLYEVTYDGTNASGTDTNTASQLFTGIAANTMDRIFHGANNANVSAAGNTWTVSNASIVAVPEPSVALVFAVAGLAGLGCVLRRRC